MILMDNHGVLVVGESVADAWHQLYFLERACQVQVLAQSTGSPLLQRARGGCAAHRRAVPRRRRAGRVVRRGATRARSRQSRLRALTIRTVVVGDYDGAQPGGGGRDRRDARAQARRAAAARDGRYADGRLPRARGAAARGELDTSQLRAAQLDEYAGLAADDRRSLYGWMERAFLEPLGVPAERTIRLDAVAAARRRVPRLRRRGGGRRRLRPRGARPRAERPPRLQRAADRARRSHAARAADAREHAQQRALLGRRGQRAARGADLRPGLDAGGARRSCWSSPARTSARSCAAR